MVSAVGADFSPGDIVGNTYEVIGYIGRGAMGYVYHVRHTELPKEYALKTLSTEQITETAWLRFQIEAQSIAKMFHPNIITIHNFAVHKAADRVEQPFYVMDLLAGRSLMEELRDNDPLPLPRALSVFSQAASGIGYAHSKGIIHRDIKPGNVMLLDKPDTSGATVKIVDFGIAKLTADSEIAQQHLTSAGEVFGSPFYMSPEQGLGQKVDARSDVYSLGVTFFEALTGDLPFKANSAVDIMLLHQSAPVPQLNTFVEAGDFPQAVQIVLERMLAKEPNKRYQNMQEVVADLTAIHFGNPLPSLGSEVAHAQDLGLGRRTMQSQAQDPDDDLSDSGFDGEESLQGQVWVSGDDESDGDLLDGEHESDGESDPELGVDHDAEAVLATGADTGSQTVLHETGRALVVISTPAGRPKAQVIFLAISLVAVLGSALVYVAIKAAGHQASTEQLVAGLGKTGANSSRVHSGAGGDDHGKSHHSRHSHHEHDSHDKDKPAAVVIKEPSESLKSTKPFVVNVREVKNGKMIDFDFPTDTLIGKFECWNWTNGKGKTDPAQGHLKYGPTDWLMFHPSPILCKYPQYIKRFRPGDFSGLDIEKDTDSDELLAGFTVMPDIDELKIINTQNLTNKCIASLAKFTKLAKFDGSHSTLDGIALARANCWGNIKEFRCSHCRNITPLLEKLKSSKNLFYLDVHESDLSYQDYKAISALSGLRELKFKEEPISLNELKLLSSLPNLETIELPDCGLEEASIPIMRQFKALKKLKMGSPKTLVKLRDKFKAGLPGVKVE